MSMYIGNYIVFIIHFPYFNVLLRSANKEFCFEMWSIFYKYKIYSSEQQNNSQNIIFNYIQ